MGACLINRPTIKYVFLCVRLSITSGPHKRVIDNRKREHSGEPGTFLGIHGVLSVSSNNYSDVFGAELVLSFLGLGMLTAVLLCLSFAPLGVTFCNARAGRFLPFHSYRRGVAMPVETQNH